MRACAEGWCERSHSRCLGALPAATEGFDTRDLKEAKALLEELAV